MCGGLVHPGSDSVCSPWVDGAGRR